MKHSFHGVFSNLPVLVTGHTGFKGSWLSLWLRELGARVIGYSLPEPPSTPSNFEICGLGERVVDIRGDVRDLAHFEEIVAREKPVVVFHLAAQPIVLTAYEQPVYTFEVNVMGTVNVLETVRHVSSVKAAVCVTTDKVYANREWVWGYREDDRLGGDDPYSASKAMAELAIAAYRRSFLAEAGTAVASARAGNVIGGGDFADFRLVPDAVRALMAGEAVPLRNPRFVRPWQHVLESLSGYLWLATLLLEEGNAYAEAWNFAPQEARAVTAQEVVARIIELWEGGRWEHRPATDPPKETITLRLSRDKAVNRLRWRPVYDWEQAVASTVAWYRKYQQGLAPEEMYGACAAEIAAYTAAARRLHLPWAAHPDSSDAEAG